MTLALCKAGTYKPQEGGKHPAKALQGSRGQRSHGCRNDAKAWLQAGGVVLSTQYLPDTHRTQGAFSAPHESGVVMHASNVCTQEVEAGGPKVHGQP